MKKTYYKVWKRGGPKKRDRKKYFLNQKQTYKKG